MKRFHGIIQFVQAPSPKQVARSAIAPGPFVQSNTNPVPIPKSAPPPRERKPVLPAAKSVLPTPSPTQKEEFAVINQKIELLERAVAEVSQPNASGLSQDTASDPIPLSTEEQHMVDEVHTAGKGRGGKVGRLNSREDTQEGGGRAEEETRQGGGRAEEEDGRGGGAEKKTASPVLTPRLLAAFYEDRC